MATPSVKVQLGFSAVHPPLRGETVGRSTLCSISMLLLSPPPPPPPTSSGWGRDAARLRGGAALPTWAGQGFRFRQVRGFRVRPGQGKGSGLRVGQVRVSGLKVRQGGEVTIMW